MTQQASTAYTFEFHGGHTTCYPIYLRPNGNNDSSNIPKVDTRNKAATDRGLGLRRAGLFAPSSSGRAPGQEVDPRCLLPEEGGTSSGGLDSTYGPRLQGLFLYGSMARGDEQAGSDVDVLIVLDDVPHYFEELERTAQLVSDLSLAYDVTISRTLMSADRWRDGDEPFLRTVRQDVTAA